MTWSKKTMANMNEQNGQQQQQVVGNAISKKGAWGGNRVGVAQSSWPGSKRSRTTRPFRALPRRLPAGPQRGAVAAAGRHAGRRWSHQSRPDPDERQSGPDRRSSSAPAPSSSNSTTASTSTSRAIPSRRPAGWPLCWAELALWRAARPRAPIRPATGSRSSLASARRFGNFFADGGVVRRAGGGGVMPYPALKDSPWGAISFDGSPYSNSGDFGAYLPTASSPARSRNSPRN